MAMSCVMRSVFVGTLHMRHVIVMSMRMVGSMTGVPTTRWAHDRSMRKRHRSLKRNPDRDNQDIKHIPETHTLPISKTPDRLQTQTPDSGTNRFEGVVRT